MPAASMRFGSTAGNVQTVRRLPYVRGVVKATDECIGRNVYRAFDVTIAPQRKIRQPAIPCGHPKCIATLASSMGRSKACSNLISCACVSPNFPVISATGCCGNMIVPGRTVRMAAGKLDVFDSFGNR